MGESGPRQTATHRARDGSVGTVPQGGARHRPSARDALALANTELTQTHPLSEGRREATASRGQRDHVPTPAAQEEGATRTRPKATREGICQPEIVTVRPLGSRRASALRPSSPHTENTGGTERVQAAFKAGEAASRPKTPRYPGDIRRGPCKAAAENQGGPRTWNLPAREAADQAGVRTPRGGHAARGHGARSGDPRDELAWPRRAASTGQPGARRPGPARVPGRQERRGGGGPPHAVSGPDEVSFRR